MLPPKTRPRRWQASEQASKQGSKRGSLGLRSHFASEAPSKCTVASRGSQYPRLDPSNARDYGLSVVRMGGGIYNSGDRKDRGPQLEQGARCIGREKPHVERQSTPPGGAKKNE